MSQQVTTSEVRFSFVNVFNPKINPQGIEKYSITCLLPKADTEGLKIINEAIRKEYEEHKEGKLKGVAKPRTPIWDGDGAKQDGTEFGPECKGCWVFAASSGAERPPAVVDQNVQPILKPTDLYSGCYGHVALSVYAYNNQSKGIGFGLNGVQKTKDGEPLGYHFDAKRAFNAVKNQNENTNGVDPITGLPLNDDRISF